MAVAVAVVEMVLPQLSKEVFAKEGTVDLGASTMLPLVKLTVVLEAAVSVGLEEEVKEKKLLSRRRDGV